MIQYKLGDEKISTDRLKTVLSMCTCEMINEYQIDLDNVSGNYEFEKVRTENQKEYTTIKINKKEDITRKDFLTMQKHFDIDLDACYLKINEFTQELKKIKYKVAKNKTE